MRQTILYLLRHGQTHWNAEKRLQGHVDIPLNEIGIAEAEILAQEFAGHTFDAIYSSPLIRAHATAQIINRSHGHSIQTHEALKEATYGSFDGVKIEEYRHRWAADMPLDELIHYKIAPNAESYFEVYQRAKPFLDEIARHHLGKQVLVVSHGALIRGLIGMLTNTVMHNITVPNIGCVTLQGDGSELSIVEYKRITCK